MKQTAVKWLEKELLKQGFGGCIQLFEQAKEVEKQYIMDAFIVGLNQGVFGYKSAKDYYKKIYKK